MIVNTTAQWDPQSSSFILNSPGEGAKKNWISQGLVADKTVVVADLRVGEKSMGPHAFLMDLRVNGVVVPGVSHGDMGPKTVGNDLDNAWISFDHIRLPKSSLLNRYGDLEVDEKGSVKYIQKVKGLPVFHMIGQRLFTGRVAVARAALTFCDEIFNSTKKYTDNKMCWAPKGQVSLSSLPQLAHLYAEGSHTRALLQTFLDRVEEELSACLRANAAPSVELVQAIAVAKVKSVEESISLTHRLKNEVGSYALMSNVGFGQSDFLQCCKFAEGDSRILMQKMARDRMKVYTDSLTSGVQQGGVGEEKLCADLQALLKQDVDSGRAPSRAEAWDLRWREVYSLAEAVMERVIQTYVAKR